MESLETETTSSTLPNCTSAVGILAYTPVTLSDPLSPSRSYDSACMMLSACIQGTLETLFIQRRGTGVLGSSLR